MVKCPKCGRMMHKVMHFEKEVSYAYHLCKNCITKTHKKRIHYDDIYNETTQKCTGGVKYGKY